MIWGRVQFLDRDLMYLYILDEFLLAKLLTSSDSKSAFAVDILSCRRDSALTSLSWLDGDGRLLQILRSECIQFRSCLISGVNHLGHWDVLTLTFGMNRGEESMRIRLKQD